MKRVSEYVDLNLLMSSLIALVILLVVFLSQQVNATEVTGAGSSFVYPILSKWADAYKKETGVSINYQSVGSGAGIKQVQSRTVDFGASDMPMKPEDLDKNSLTQFPVVNGGIVAVVNVEGIKAGELQLDSDLLAAIFLGKVTKWDDASIKKLNPKLALPSTAITVVHRADGSGTTFVFTNYLSKVNSEWKEKVGEGTTVNWPVGVGGKGNEGISSNVQQIKGSIGYVEYAYALQNNMAHTKLKNAAGQFVEPNRDSFLAAAAGADWSKSDRFFLIMTNAAGKKSWPIAGSTFVLIPKVQKTPEQSAAALKFFKWTRKQAAMAEELHYIPLPKSIDGLVDKSWKEIKTEDGKPVAVGI